MNFNAVYFSPTGNTEKTIKAIEEGIGEKFKNYNITLKKNRDEKIKFTKNDLVILGCPVYVGRIPNIEDDLFKNIKQLASKIKITKSVNEYATSLQGVFFEQASYLSQYHLTHEVMPYSR